MKSLESSGDSVFKMLMYTMMIGAVVAIFIMIVVSIIEDREERPLSSMNASHGDQVQPYLVPDPHNSVATGAQDHLKWLAWGPGLPCPGWTFHLGAWRAPHVLKTVGPVMPTPGDPRETGPVQGKRPLRRGLQ